MRILKQVSSTHTKKKRRRKSPDVKITNPLEVTSQRLPHLVKDLIGYLIDDVNNPSLISRRLTTADLYFPFYPILRLL